MGLYTGGAVSCQSLLRIHAVTELKVDLKIPQVYQTVFSYRNTTQNAREITIRWHKECNMLAMSHSKEAHIALARMSVLFEYKATTGIG